MRKYNVEHKIYPDSISPAERKNPQLAYDEGFREGFANGYLEGFLRGVKFKLVPRDEEENEGV